MMTIILEVAIGTLALVVVLVIVQAVVQVFAMEPVPEPANNL